MGVVTRAGVAAAPALGRGVEVTKVTWSELEKASSCGNLLVASPGRLCPELVHGAGGGAVSRT